MSTNVIAATQKATGLSWGAIVTGCLFFAFVLYIAQAGNLGKYKAWLL